MGWLAPTLVVAKVLLQDVCLDGSDRDSPVSATLGQRWSEFCSTLPDVSRVRVSRWLGTSESGPWHLHAFADASKRAYAAALYAVTPGGLSTLLVAKTKLAPTKVQTIPRLELCAATLLARLVRNMLDNLRFPPAQVHCWTDSSVVLEWIRGHSSKWPTFVANRVSEIQISLPDVCWRHVRTANNPADCATRGLAPKDLAAFSLWWTGPAWLVKEKDQWPKMDVAESIVQTMVATKARPDSRPAVEGECMSEFDICPNFRMVLKVLALIYRWHSRASHRVRGTPVISKADALRKARIGCFRSIQRFHFADEVTALREERILSKRSHLSRLCPFYDRDGLLRDGGRLQNARVPFDEKHPIILPGGCAMVKRLVRQAHLETLHGGAQLMSSHLARQFWNTRGARVIQAVCHGCVKCTRFRAVSLDQQMAPLPSARVTPGRPFATTALDYAGPMSILFSRGRGAKTTKGYVAIFVCLLTRAVHIEVVSDLTTRAFLAAYSRFCARRGRPSIVYSDNATTFKGAAVELKSLFEKSSSFSRRIQAQLSEQGTKWSFIPPRAPHFGGLWEAAVRSFKHHFRRVVGETGLTFEELATLAARIEACLNSRPLRPLSSQPEDYAALTPGHFLVGSVLLDYPEPLNEGEILSLTDRWRLLCGLRDSFWRRWRKEVLSQMQQRNK
ncbi:hypothetical protein TKK_0005512 [Trichogramma kaykai]